MAIGLSEEVEAVSAHPPKWRALIRQNSEKIGTFAEDVVLPKHRRSMHRISTNAYGVLPLRDVERDAIYGNTTTETQSSEMQPKYFPVFMISISVIQVGLKCFMSKYDNIFPMLLLGYDPHRRYQFWRFFTILFLHTRLSLFTNVLFQLLLGVLLEIVHKWTRVAAIYFASVIGGSLFITLLSPNNYVVYSSAGVYGLLFSHLSTIILNWKEMEKKSLRLVMLSIFVIVDVAMNSQLLPDEADTNYAGHLGGAITGFLVSILVLKNFEQQQWKKKIRIGSVAILTCLAIIIALVNIVAWDYYLPTEWNTNYHDSYVDFVYQRAITSSEGSVAREYCKQFTKCKVLINQHTISSRNTT